jgi:hypothetical protein
MESPRLVGPMLAAFTGLAVACFAASMLLRESAVLSAPAEGEGAGA